jgi:hypothetical protein
MNLIGSAMPHLRREMRAGIPQTFGSRSAEHRGSTEAGRCRKKNGGIAASVSDFD